MIISHNSFSYLPPMRWWQRLINWTSKCQDKDIKAQAAAGADGFDIRIRYNHKGEELLCHGLVDYAPSTELFHFISLLELNRNKTFYVRVILEHCESQEDINRFASFCSTLEELFPKIIFFGGQRKRDWAQLYNFL